MTLRFTHFDLEAPDSELRNNVCFVNLICPWEGRGGGAGAKSAHADFKLLETIGVKLRGDVS